MNQSTYIVGALLLGFVLFLAAQNRLSAYTAVLWGATAAPTPTPTVPASTAGSSSGGFSLGSIGTALDGATNAAGLLGF